MSILRRARVLDHHNALADHHSARTAEEMKLINALNLPAALQNPPGTITAGRKSCQRRSLASVNELRRAVFPGMRSKDSKLEPQDVKSDSGSSVASSVAARKIWECVCVSVAAQKTSLLKRYQDAAP